ncbi:MAG: AtpZ/AtpI family protein [Phycisphaerae bacterium]|nr:AtpZ/AtpI family protein [Phycisphaerae bacterium]
MAKPPLHRMMRYATAGIELAIIFALWVLLGWWLDNRWGTSPALILTGAVVGFALGMYRMVRDAQRAFRESAREQNDAETPGRDDKESS